MKSISTQARPCLGLYKYVCKCNRHSCNINVHDCQNPITSGYYTFDYTWQEWWMERRTETNPPSLLPSLIYPLDPDWNLDPSDWLIGTREWILTTPCCLLPSLQSLVSFQKFARRFLDMLHLQKPGVICHVKQYIGSRRMNYSPLLHW